MRSEKKDAVFNTKGSTFSRDCCEVFEMKYIIPLLLVRPTRDEARVPSSSGNIKIGRKTETTLMPNQMISCLPNPLKTTAKKPQTRTNQKEGWRI